MLRFITISLLVHGLAIGAWYLARAAAQDIPVDRVVSLSLQITPPASSRRADTPQPERTAQAGTGTKAAPAKAADDEPDKGLAELAVAETASRDGYAQPDIPGNNRMVIPNPAEPGMDQAMDVNEVRNAVARAIRASFRYPRKARRKGWEGTVILTLLVQADGHLTDIQVIGSSGIPLLDQDAVATARTITLPRREHHILAQAVEIILPIQYQLLEG